LGKYLSASNLAKNKNFRVSLGVFEPYVYSLQSLGNLYSKVLFTILSFGTICIFISETPRAPMFGGVVPLL
jgi:hypothetical protein